MTEKPVHYLFSLGEPHPILRERAPLSEGMVASMVLGPTLTMIFDRPTRQDVRLVRENRVRLGLVPLLPLGYVWLIDIKDVGYFEAPFAPGMEAPELQKLTQREPGMHLLVNLHLLDTMATIHVMRVFTVTPGFWEVLDRLHTGALATPFDDAAWGKAVTAYQSRFNTPKDAFVAAEAISFGGLKGRH